MMEVGPHARVHPPPVFTGLGHDTISDGPASPATPSTLLPPVIGSAVPSKVMNPLIDGSTPASSISTSGPMTAKVGQHGSVLLAAHAKSSGRKGKSLTAEAALYRAHTTPSRIAPMCYVVLPREEVQSATKSRKRLAQQRGGAWAAGEDVEQQLQQMTPEQYLDHVGAHHLIDRLINHLLDTRPKDASAALRDMLRAESERSVAEKASLEACPMLTSAVDIILSNTKDDHAACHRRVRALCGVLDRLLYHLTALQPSLAEVTCTVRRETYRAIFADLPVDSVATVPPDDSCDVDNINSNNLNGTSPTLASLLGIPGGTTGGGVVIVGRRVLPVGLSANKLMEALGSGFKECLTWYDRWKGDEEIKQELISEWEQVFLQEQRHTELLRSQVREWEERYEGLVQKVQKSETISSAEQRAYLRRVTRLVSDNSDDMMDATSVLDHLGVDTPGGGGVKNRSGGDSPMQNPRFNALEQAKQSYSAQSDTYGKVDYKAVLKEQQDHDKNLQGDLKLYRSCFEELIGDL